MAVSAMAPVIGLTKTATPSTKRAFVACFKLRGTADDEDVASVRLEPKRDVERRPVGALDQHAGDVLAQSPALEIGWLDSTEDDRNARKQRFSVPQQEVQGRPYHRDDEVQAGAGSNMTS
jgi:hypothetical protein